MGLSDRIVNAMGLTEKSVCLNGRRRWFAPAVYPLWGHTPPNVNCCFNSILYPNMKKKILMIGDTSDLQGVPIDISS
jgi:hypothetical protein